MTLFLAPVAAFAAGFASSSGPCVAPRLAALAGITAGCRGLTRAVRVVAFAAGSCSGYAILAACADALRRLAEYSALTYALLAAGFATAGACALLRAGRHGCGAFGAPALPLGAAFLAGIAFAVIGSPCCGPAAAALFAAAASAAPVSHALVPAFALGHVVPLVAAAAGWHPVATVVWSRVPATALATAAGAVALGLAGYYALLA